MSRMNKSRIMSITDVDLNAPQVKKKTPFDVQMLYTYIVKWMEWNSQVPVVQILRKSFKKWTDVVMTPIHNIATRLCLSIKGQRTSDERQIIKDWLLTHEQGFSLFHKMDSNDMDKLCNEVDIHYYSFPSIVFLQGERGRHTYIITHGSVRLYYEMYKLKEMEILRQFGDKRGKHISEKECELLGEFTKTLNPGTIFGDVATLSNSDAARSAAVITNEDTLLLIVPVTLYHAVLRELRLSVLHVTVAITALRELPVFRQYSYPKVTNIAYSLEFLTVAWKSTIVSYGDEIKCLFLIVQGSVSAIPKQNEDIAHPHQRGPSVVLTSLGRGMIIGEREKRRKLHTFQMTYVASTDCEMFRMRCDVYEEYANASKLKQTSGFYTAKANEELLDEILTNQANRQKKFQKKYTDMITNSKALASVSASASAPILFRKERANTTAADSQHDAAAGSGRGRGSVNNNTTSSATNTNILTNRDLITRNLSRSHVPTPELHCHNYSHSNNHSHSQSHHTHPSSPVVVAVTAVDHPNTATVTGQRYTLGEECNLSVYKTKASAHFLGTLSRPGTAGTIRPQRSHTRNVLPHELVTDWPGGDSSSPGARPHTTGRMSGQDRSKATSTSPEKKERPRSSGIYLSTRCKGFSSTMTSSAPLPNHNNNNHSYNYNNSRDHSPNQSPLPTERCLFPLDPLESPMLPSTSPSTFRMEITPEFKSSPDRPLTAGGAHRFIPNELKFDNHFKFLSTTGPGHHKGQSLDQRTHVIKEEIMRRSIFHRTVKGKPISFKNSGKRVNAFS
eukprot:gene5856-11825_t